MPSTALPLATVPGGLVALPGVYRPQADTRLLATALAHEDLGPHARVTAVDVSLPAVVTARLNAWTHGLPVRVLHGDFEARTTGRSFDMVVSTPPVRPRPRQPTANARAGTGLGRGARRARDCRPDLRGRPGAAPARWNPAHGALRDVRFGRDPRPADAGRAGRTGHHDGCRAVGARLAIAALLARTAGPGGRG